MVGLSKITVNPELILTLELDLETPAIVAFLVVDVLALDDSAAGRPTLDTPALVWLNVYECQLPNSSWKQCTAPSVVSS